MNDLGARKGAQSFIGLLGFVSVIRPQLRQGSLTLAEDFFFISVDYLVACSAKKNNKGFLLISPSLKFKKVK